MLSPDEEISWTFENPTHFSAAFDALNQLRLEGTLTDIRLRVTPTSTPIPAHKLVLMSSSEYFRVMFKTCFSESRDEDIVLPGVDHETLEAIVDYFYTGKIGITFEMVESLLSASALLLISALTIACGNFLIDHLAVENCLDCLELGKMYCIEDLRRTALRFIDLHFEAVAMTPEFLELRANDLEEILKNDDLVVENEEFVFNALLNWMISKQSSLSGDATMSQFAPLWNLVRFPLLSATFTAETVQRSDFFGAIERSEAFKGTIKREKSWSQWVRKRGRNDVVIAHSDGANGLEYFNSHSDKWDRLIELPAGVCGVDYVGMVGLHHRLLLIGGRGSDGSSLRTTASLDLESGKWTRGPDMTTYRWYHGVCRVNNVVYAVAGCGQLNTIEALELDPTDGSLPVDSRWRLLSPMRKRRHLPGVAALAGRIIVLGGSNDEWEAFAEAESYDPATDTWTELPPMNCPRIHPAVTTFNGCLYVFGGRNSKKVELKSAERFDPESNSWTLIQSMRHKRWSSAAISFGDRILVIGGKGKWASAATVEVYDPEADEWSEVSHGVQYKDRVYAATVVKKPWAGLAKAFGVSE